jgi:hypothetical protein
MRVDAAVAEGRMMKRLPLAAWIVVAVPLAAACFDERDAQIVDTSGGAGTVANTPVTLASGQMSPHGVAVDSENVYWTNGGGLASDVMKMGKLGGIVTPIASAEREPGAIAVDDASVFWTTVGNCVRRVSKSGGAPAPVGSAGCVARDVAVDSTSIYWTDDTGNVKKVGKSSGASTTIATGNGADHGLQRLLVVDAETPTEGGPVRREAVEDLEPRAAQALPQVADVAAEAGEVLFDRERLVGDDEQSRRLTLDVLRPEHLRERHRLAERLVREARQQDRVAVLVP